MDLYTGTVIFPADPEPYEGKFGPSFNVRVKIDQPNAPKTNAQNEASIYARAGTDKAEFLRSLRKGTTVTMVYNDNGKSTWYDFVTQANEKKESAKKGVPAKQVNVWTPPSADESAVYNAIFALTKEQLKSMIDDWADEYPDATFDEIIRLATTTFINVSRTYKPNMTLADAEPIFEKERDDIVLSQWGNDPKKLLELIAELEPSFEGTEMPIVILKELGFKSDEIATGEDAVNAALAVWQVASLINEGAKLDAAISIVDDEINGDNDIPW